MAPGGRAALLPGEALRRRRAVRGGHRRGGLRSRLVDALSPPPLPDRRGALAAAINRAIQLRGCPASHAIPGGWLLQRPQSPRLHYLNALRLRAAPGDADTLEALAERWQADLPHRFVVIEDPAADALADEMLRRGWRRDRALLMALDLDRASLRPADPRVCEVDEVTFAEVELTIFEEANAGPHAHPELPGQLASGMAALRAATACRRFAAGDPGEPLAAVTTLYLDPDVGGTRVAQVESVGTLRDWRERGLASGCVSAAVRAAARWGAELVTLVTDADDWPQLLYAGLGFAPVAHQVAFARVDLDGR